MNRFVGQLPSNISLVFPYLTDIDASHNNIFGHLPSSLCNISNLRFVDLSNNQLTREVPTCLFTRCFSLILSNNNLGGLILGGANNLSIGGEIYLDGNNFKGSLPNNLSGVMCVMDLHDNKLYGELDVSFWNLSSLQVLNVANNILTGEINPKICNLTSLEFLDMSDNNFEGPIPNCDRKLTLKFLNMSSNTLSGFLTAFCNSSYVTVLDLGYNHFVGGLDWIHRLSLINILLLRGNKFEGQIPSSLCQLQYLNIIDLSHNRLSGLLPHCIGGISFGYSDGFKSYEMEFVYVFYFRYDVQGFSFSTKGNHYTYSCRFFYLMSGINLSRNMLSGEIPLEIGNLSHVKSLNLSHNSFTGRIPTTFANMSTIESLDLSFNHLSGPIPWQLTLLWSLEVFSVAYNNLSGCIPNSGQFSSFGAECYIGNTNLHNLSHGNQCSPVLGPVEAGDLCKSKIFADPILYITSAASFVLAFWATIGFVFYHPYGQRLILQL
jgi:Leucine-rich repeat (LRR) protein